MCQKLYEGSVVRPMASRVHKGCFTKRNLESLRSLSAFLLHKKTLHFRARFLLVDYTFEISNLDLVKDIAEVVEYLNPKE